AWLQSGKDENLAVGSDFENCSAAVSNVQEALTVKRDPGRHSHALGVDRDGSIQGRFIDVAVKPAGNIQDVIPVEGQSGRIHDLREERLHVVIRVYLVHTDRYLLAARAAEGHIDVSILVDGRIRYGVHVVGDGNADLDSDGVAALVRS